LRLVYHAMSVVVSRFISTSVFRWLIFQHLHLHAVHIDLLLKGLNDDLAEGFFEL